MLLYQPTPAEITPLMERARATWPQLVTRIDKAADLLSGAHGRIDAYLYHGEMFYLLPSHSTPGLTHRVVNQICDCKDHRAPLVAGRRFCMHTITTAAYMRALHLHLDADLAAGDASLLYANDYNHEQVIIYPPAHTLPGFITGRVLTSARPRWEHDGYAIAYAAYLARRSRALGAHFALPASAPTVAMAAD